MRMRNKMWLCAALAGLLLCASCTRVPVTGRMQLAFQYPDTSAAIKEQLTAASEHGVLKRDFLKMIRVRRIARELQPALAYYDRDRRAVGISVHLVANRVPNAWVRRQGHRIIVTHGLLTMHLTNAEIAAVLAHEMGHLVANHIAERLTAIDFASMLLGFRLDETPTNPVAALLEWPVKTPAKLIYLYPLERKQELEADEIGLHIMARAGFDPHAMASFFQKIARINRNSHELSILNNHPA